MPVATGRMLEKRAPHETLDAALACRSRPKCARVAAAADGRRLPPPAIDCCVCSIAFVRQQALHTLAMKQTLIFSRPSKVHDIRSIRHSPTASVVPQPSSSPSPSPSPSRGSKGNNNANNDHRHAGPSLSLSSPSSSPTHRALELQSPQHSPNNGARQFFCGKSTQPHTQRMPTLRSPLDNSSPSSKATARTAPSIRRSVSVSARSRAIRDYDSKRLADIGREVTYPWVILPRAQWKVRWDLWIGLIILYSVVLIPYRIGFGIDIDRWEQVLNYGFDASFAVDVVFNFFTGFYDADILIHEIPKIRDRYLRSWFLFDVLSTIPFDQFLQVVSTASSSLLTLKLLRTIRLFRLLKLMRLLRLKRAIEAIQMDALNAHVLQTLKSLVMILFIIHLISCGWYLFYTWDPTGVNWVTTISTTGIAHPYLVSFYWVSNTMMSVGYGDICAVTDAERIYSIFVEALGSISVGMIIANIQMLTENYNPRGIKLKQKVQETKEFLLKRNIPRRLRQRVLSQFEYHWSRRTVFDEDRLLHQFPVSLQYEILAASMEPFVKRFPFFGVTSVDFFVFVVPRLRPIVLGPGQALVDAESVWEELYFITSGNVESIRVNVIVGSLTPGDICGIEYLVADRKRYTHTYRSVLKTELFAIYSRDLIAATQKCPIAHKYLTDLATILSERYAESARRGRRAILKQQSLRRLQEQQSQQSVSPRSSMSGVPAVTTGTPYVQYRHRKTSLTHNHIHAHELDSLRQPNLYATDEIKTHWSVVRHYSRLRMIWDVIIGIMVAMTALTVPFRISFDVQDTEFLYLSDRISDICFILDIALSFLTTYVDDTGVEIVDRHEIRRHYLKTNFVVDLVSTIPFDFFVESLTAEKDFRSLKLFRTIKLVKLLRLVRLSKLYKMNMQWTSELDISMDTVRLLKLLAPVMTIAHYVGCFWYYMSAQRAKDDSWWGRIYLDDHDATVSKYIASVYWATTTMTTVGFGDIYAANNAEQAYSILVMIGGTTLFAYVVGTVIEVVSNSKSLMNREHEMIQNVSAYIKERGVSHEFTMACQEHLRYLNAEKTLFFEPGLFGALCYGLRSELILNLNANILAKIRFFDKKPKWFLTLVLPRLVPQYFLTGDLLIYHGNPVSGIYFLMTGAVVVKAPQQMATDADQHGSHTDTGATATASAAERDRNIAMLYEGEFFGYKEVLTHALAQYNAFAVKAAGTYLLPRDFFDEFAVTYPHVMDEMRAMLMHAIHKQQTIVHHWQNNDAIGMFGNDREVFLRQSFRNSNATTAATTTTTSAGLGDIAEAAFEDSDDLHGYSRDRSASDLPQSQQHQMPSPPLKSSVAVEPSRSRTSLLHGHDDEDDDEDDDEEVYNNNNNNNVNGIDAFCPQSDGSNDHIDGSANKDRVVRQASHEALDRLEHGINDTDADVVDSLSGPTPAHIGPRVPHNEDRRRRLQHNASTSHLGAHEPPPTDVRPRRGSFLDYPTSRSTKPSSTRSHSVQVDQSVAAAFPTGMPQLRRYPSSTKEIDAIVKQLLLVEGYQAPRLDTSSNFRPTP